MYGLINIGIKDFIKNRVSKKVWSEICNDLELDRDVVFEALNVYDDKLTYDLVGVISEKLSLEPAEVLERFGIFWVQFTGAEGYGQLMDLFGKDMITFLKNLNSMHARMGSMMPNLKAPRFVVEELSKNEVDLYYYSEREGLGPMVKGLLIGLSNRFGQEIEVHSHFNRHEDGGIKFKILIGV